MNYIILYYTTLNKLIYPPAAKSPVALMNVKELHNGVHLTITRYNTSTLPAGIIGNSGVMTFVLFFVMTIEIESL